ncbi:hypothetical protein SDC9_68568 [bioreactor metagenome]|uniref:Uncharacterized protein n=1 Tax=bioreactor metagenome TaxID=1076179 RepID=A0A644Y273_9ZZZZ
MTHDFRDDERQELLGELGIQMRFLGQRTQPLDLLGLANWIRRREIVGCLEHPHALGDLEALRQKVHEGGVHIVDGSAQAPQLGHHVVICHMPTLSQTAVRPAALIRLTAPGLPLGRRSVGRQASAGGCPAGGPSVGGCPSGGWVVEGAGVPVGLCGVWGAVV